MRKEMTFWLVFSLLIHVAAVTSVGLFSKRRFIKVYSPGIIHVTLIEPRQEKAPVHRRIKSQFKIHKQRIVKSIPRSRVVVRRQRIIRRIKKGAIPTKNPREERLKKAIERIKERVEQRETTSEHPEPVVGSGSSIGEKNLYLSVIRSRIMQGWIIPENLIENVYSLIAVVNFTIYSDGHISNVYLEDSSGNRYFDESAIRAVKQAAPFPPLPTSLREKSMEIGIRFRPEEKGDG